MTDELVLLGQSAAGALAQAMVSEVWNQARSLIMRVRLFRRDDPETASRHERWLDRDRARLMEDPDSAARIRQEWVTRIGDWLEHHPDAISDLKEVLQGLENLLPNDSTSAHVVAHQRADHGSFNQVAGRDVNNYHGISQ